MQKEGRRIVVKTKEMTEEQYILFALSKGQRSAFDMVFRKYYPSLCAYARRFVEMEDAEEIAQEIMIWLWENRSRLTIETSLQQYLFKMTYNRSLNLIAKKEAAVRAETNFYTVHQQLPDDLHLWQVEDLNKKVQEAIAMLPDSYRTTFVMHRFKNMSYKEIAEALEVSPKTVDYRIQQALKQLRVELKEYLPILSLVLQTDFMGETMNNLLK